MEKRTEEIKKKMEEFENSSNVLNNSEEYEKVNFDIRRSKNLVKRYEDELTHLDTASMPLNEAIREEASVKEALKMAKEELEKHEKEKADLDSKTQSRDNKKEIMELRNKKSAYYTQTKAKLGMERSQIKLKMQQNLLERDNPNGVSPAELTQQYHALQDELADIDEAITLCDGQIQAVKDEWNIDVEKVNEILSRKDEVVEEPKAETQESEEPEPEVSEMEEIEEEISEVEEPVNEEVEQEVSEMEEIEDAEYEDIMTDERSLVDTNKIGMFAKIRTGLKNLFNKIAAKFGKKNRETEEQPSVSEAETSTEDRNESNPWEASQEVKDATTRAGQEAAEHGDESKKIDDYEQTL